MSARHEALALVELGHEVIQRAWAYQTTWAALEAGRVPAKLRREVLDASFTPARTEALGHVRAWDGSDVPQIILGGVGVGKSYAAACWLRDRAVAGQSIAWVSATELGSLPFERDFRRPEDRGMTTIRDEELRANKACATVIDDLGAGALGGSVMKRINAVMLGREAQGLPTLALLNESKDGDGASWLKDNIDPRLIDRMRGGGSRLIRLKPAKSLRGSRESDDGADPKTGRGRAWNASAALLRTVGVVDDSDGEQWQPGSTRTLLRPAFGGALEIIHSRRDDWPEIMGRLARALKVSVADVRARAAELEASEGGRMQAGERVPVDLGEGRAVVGLSGFVDALAQGVAEAGRHGRPIKAGDIMIPRERARRPVGPEPTLADGERMRLAALGYLVRFSTLTQEFELRIFLDSKKRKSRLLGMHATESHAWDEARQLQATANDGAWSIEKTA